MRSDLKKKSKRTYWHCPVALRSPLFDYHDCIKRPIYPPVEFSPGKEKAVIGIPP